MNDQDLLTLFAGMALQGLIAAKHEASAKSIAMVAYDIAEAMVKEREARDERNNKSNQSG
jgi:hypothetical protein